MRVITSLVLATALAGLAAAVLSTDPHSDQHLACYTANNSTWQILVDPPNQSNFSVTGPNGTQSTNIAALSGPPSGGAWPAGVTFANNLRAQNLFPLTAAITSASWTRDNSSRADTFTFNASDGSSAVFDSTTCAGWGNCNSLGDFVLKHCWSGLETCCGAGGMFPQCIDVSSGDQCCTHFLGAAACNTSQVCCGSLGPGASSNAFCCDGGSTCCMSNTQTEGASCCPAGSKCCAASNLGFCCGANEVCNLQTLTCDSECGWVYIDAELVLNGTGWQNVSANATAWKALPGALVSDLASLLGRTPQEIDIEKLTASASNLTIVFIVKSNALAEAARIAALIRDDVPSSAPLPATLNVYASVNQSAANVSVASHNAISRDVFACTTNAPGSPPNQLTTMAPGAASGSGSECGWVFIDAEFVLSGAGWQNVKANATAWNALHGALVSDLASLLGRTPQEINIESLTAVSNSLTVVFTAKSNALAEAARIAALIRDDISPSSPMPATLNVYASVGQSAANVKITTHNAISRDAFACATTAAPSNASAGNAGMEITVVSAGFADSLNNGTSPASPLSTWNTMLLTFAMMVMTAVALAR